MERKLTFADYSEVIQNSFKDVNDLKTFNRICVDTYKNKVQKYSVEEANTVIRNKILEIAGLQENPTDRQLRKAFRKTAVREAIFEILEETIDDALITGWGADPFMRKFVDFKTAVLGQKNAFYVKKDCILTISKIAPSHHDIKRQRLAGGSTRTVATAHYGAKVYMEMSRFLQGVEDWSALVGEITRAFNLYVNTMLHKAVMSAPEQLPVPTKWNVSGQATPANKARFKRLISDVQLATGSKAMIIGTEVALSSLTGFGDVAWAADEAKSDLYKMGRLGTFEGTTIVELPQAFAPNDVENYLESDDKLLVMPEGIEPFVKFFYEGSEEIVEHSDIAENADDTKDYEFKVCMGLETITNARFGCWTIEE